MPIRTEKFGESHAIGLAPDLLIAWFNDNRASFPWRESRSPFEVFVAEMLLKRTTASAVDRVFERFLSEYPTLNELSNASEPKLAASLASLGLQNQRSKAMKSAAEWLVEVEASRIPTDFDRLAAIPGIGDYSAAAICSFAFNQRACIVDSNVERIIKRVFYRDLPQNLLAARFR